MGPVDALTLALAKEIESIELYTKILNEHPSLNEELVFLINEEQKHKKIIEKKIYELTRY